MGNNYADSVLKKVVQTFAAERKAQGISHETLAQKAGVTRAAISHIESEKRRPSLLICLKISKALNLKFWEVIKKAEK
jgi:DNA-binding XRE family transcriptional regulator